MITWCLCFLEICSAIPTKLHFQCFCILSSNQLLFITYLLTELFLLELSPVGQIHFTLSGELTLDEIYDLPVEKFWYQLGLWLQIDKRRLCDLKKKRIDDIFLETYHFIDNDDDSEKEDEDEILKAIEIMFNTTDSPTLISNESDDSDAASSSSAHISEDSDAKSVLNEGDLLMRLQKLSVF